MSTTETETSGGFAAPDAPEPQSDPVADPAPVDTPEPAMDAAPDVPWATNDVSRYTDTVLPVLGGRVRVRRLTASEITLTMQLPDLFGFRDVMSRMSMNRETRRRNKVEMPSMVESERENATYAAFLVHLAIVDPAAITDDAPVGIAAPCEECRLEDGSLLEHPPSLWTVDEARYVMPTDRDLVSGLAVTGPGVRGLAPFSNRMPDSDSPTSADSGESDPGTSYSDPTPDGGSDTP